MNIVFTSKMGESRTFSEWALEAIKFYDGLNTDEDYPVVMPTDWWERWMRILNLEEAL